VTRNQRLHSCLGAAGTESSWIVMYVRNTIIFGVGTRSEGSYTVSAIVLMIYARLRAMCRLATGLLESASQVRTEPTVKMGPIHVVIALWGDSRFRKDMFMYTMDTRKEHIKRTVSTESAAIPEGPWC
jgi:hypothetical protein